MRTGASLPRIFGMNTTSLNRALRVALISLSPLLWSHAAQAQAFHKCTVEGRVVYQSSPCQIPAPTNAAAPAAAAPTSEPAPAKKKTLAELLRERDGADRSAQVQREAQGDGANILRSRMGAV